MNKILSLLAAGVVLATLAGCVENGGRGYVESRVYNEGPVRQAYDRGPVVIEREVIVEDRGGYRDGRRYDRDRYDRDRYDRRDDGRYARSGVSERNRRAFCAEVRYQDPRCD